MNPVFFKNPKKSLIGIFLLLSVISLHAQTFPVPGLTLPPGKSIHITYEVDVNTNVCPDGTLVTPISNQSNVSGSNFSTQQTNDPANPAPDPSATLTPVSSLTLGNLVYKDNNTNGSFDAGDTGINGVIVNLYKDDGDGVLDAGDGAPLATTTTATIMTVAGSYAFIGICPGDYILEIAPSNFSPGGALYDNGFMSPLISSPVGGAPDPDNNINNDDNGDPVAGFGIASQAITLALMTEPTNDGDMDNNTNLTVDFGFKNPTLVNINDVMLAEGTGGSTTSFTFTVTRSIPDEAFSLTVNTADGTATDTDNDYEPVSGGTVSFTAGGSLTQTVTVLVNHDNKVEPNENFTVTLSGAPAGVVIQDGTGLGTITNDDAAIVTLTGTTSQPEGTSFTFTATVDNPVQGGFSVAYATNNGTATTANNDYTDNDGTLMFAGNAGENHMITVNSNPDMIVELDETFTVTLGAITGPATVTAAGSPQTGTIANDDVATVTLTGNVSQAENLGPHIYAISLSNPVDANVTLQFSTSDMTATTADNDYAGLNMQNVVFPAFSTINQIVVVSITPDNKVEIDEQFGVTLSGLTASGRNVSLGTSSGTGTIVNDDSAVITLTGTQSIAEGNSGNTPFVFNATLNNPVQGGLTVAFSTNDGTATVADNDYVDNDGTLTFTGTAGEIEIITVQGVGDLNIEPDETFTVTLGSITGAPAGITTAGSPQTGTLLNDELDYGDAPTAAQSGFAGSYPTTLISNGARHAQLPGGLRLGATVDAESDGQPNATSTGDGADEDGVTLPSSLITGLSSNITVNASGAGVLNAWMDFNRDGDWSDAGEQVFTNTPVVAGNNALSIAIPSGATLGNSFARFRLSTTSGLSFTGSTTDGEVEDYEVQIISRAISINDVTAAEGNAGTTTFTFTASLNTPAGPGGVTFDIATQNNTASTVNNDYVANTLTNQTIPEGSSTYIFNVTVNGDLIVEDNETFFVNLTNVVGAGVADAQGVGTISNDDSATLTLTGGTAQNEGNAGTNTHLFTATLSGDVQGGFQVTYTTNNATATTGDNDYQDNDGMLMFTGVSGQSQNISVLVNGDNKVELNEVFTVALGVISGTSATQAAAISTSGSPQISTILNDDAATVALSGDISQSEALTPQSFTATLSQPVDVPVSVLFSTSNGTATTADNDYTGILNQLVTFPAGTTASQSVLVTITNDNKVEANETYTASIATLNAAGRNVSLGTATRTGTIINDDAATVTLSPLTGISLAEGNTGLTPFTFNATLNNPVQGGFNLAYTTSDGTATTSNNDYTDNDGALNFAGTMGESLPITVNVIGDFSVESDETFTVALGAITGAPAGVTTAGSPQTGTILNDEVDFGDAPDPTYPTLLSSNGARHRALLGYHLGAGIDGDPDGQPSATANGDDTDAEGDDDDGVTLPGVLVLNTTADITVNASLPGFLNAWVDFNLNGAWESPAEQIFTNAGLVPGNNALTFLVPAGASTGMTFVRFRYGPAGAGPTGEVTGGEVEDYQIQIVNTQFSISDPMVVEGNAGTSNLTFVVSRTVNANACSVDYAITGGTATTADNDYQPLAAGTLNFTAGGAFSQNVTVSVIGDVKVELDETVIMMLSNPVNASILDGSGTGTITNDDAAVITISNPSVVEGCTAGTSTLSFQVNMSHPSDANVSYTYTTQNGTATTANNDYVATNGTQTLTPGQTQQTISVTVNGDCFIEANEMMSVILSGLVNNGRNITLSGGGATLTGTGTINNDDSVPQITCPGPVTVSCASQVPAVNTGSVSSTDNCGNPATITHVSDIISNQTCPNRYTLTRTYMATDGCNNTSTCTQIITVNDVTPPSITCPGPVTVQCAALVPAPNISLVMASDLCGGSPTIEFVSDVISNQTCPNRYTLTRTYRATDACGNSATCTQIITVNDNTPPMLTCPGPVTVQCASLVPPVNTALVTATDNCSGAATISHVSDVITNQTCPNRFTLTRTYRATDLCGNSATCTQVITVFDNTPPALTCPGPITVQCAADVPLPNTSLVTSTDNCGGAATIQHVSDVISNQTCLNRFIVTRTYRATDACGNSATCSQTITVFDNTVPTITFSDPLLQSVPNGGTFYVQCYGQDPNWSLPVLGVNSITATDNCAGAINVQYDITLLNEGNCETDGYINRYRHDWIVTDACGNVSTAFAFMELVDEIAPVFQGVPANITAHCDNLPPLPVITASDECLCVCDISFVQSTPAPGCQHQQVITRTWTTADACGNVATAVQYITLIDTEGPSLSITSGPLAGMTSSATLQYTCAGGGIPATFQSLTAAHATAISECGDTPVVTFSQTAVETQKCEYFGYMEQQQYTWTAIDDCGNTAQLIITAQLIDTVTPVLIGVPELACIDDPILNEIEVLDDCDYGVYRFWDVPVQNKCGTGTAIRRTYEALDVCGNMSRDTAILIPNDLIPPVLSFVNPDLAGIPPGGTLTIECAAAENQYTNFSVDDVVATDACPEALTVTLTTETTQEGQCENTGILAQQVLTWTATDICGNTAQLSATILIVDMEGPALINFKDTVTIGCKDPLPAIEYADNCGSVTEFSRDSIINGPCEFEYTIVRNIRLEDECGNVTTATQVINVGDGSGPIIYGVEAEICEDLTLPEVTAFDPCANVPVPVTLMERTFDFPCKDGELIERIWSATDVCGHTREVRQLVITNDDTPPQILTPTWSIIRRFEDRLNNVVRLSQAGIIDQLDALNEYSVWVEDGCDPDVRAVFTLETFPAADCQVDGYLEDRVYRWVATDICGNTSELFFTVRIIDDVAPVLTGIPAGTTIICGPLPAPATITAIDPAQPVLIVYAETIVATGDPTVFEATRTWTATDACGNVSTAQQTIKWIPDTDLGCSITLPPPVDCNSHNVPVASVITGGLAPYTYQWAVNGNEAQIQSGQGTGAIAVYIGFSPVVISLTVTDAFGCTSVCQTTLDCEDPLGGLQALPSDAMAQTDPDGVSADGQQQKPDTDVSALTLQPNPASGKVSIGYLTSKTSPVHIYIFNGIGQNVYETSMASSMQTGRLDVDLSGWGQGMYHVLLQSEGVVQRGSFQVLRP